MPLAAEQSNRIQELRRKNDDGTITIDELAEGILMMRENRLSAISAPRPAAKRKSEISVADMEAELGLL